MTGNRVDQQTFDERRIRNMKWYERWSVLSWTVKKGNYEDIMKAVYHLIDNTHGFRYESISHSAYEALQLAIRENNMNPIIKK